MNVLYHLKILLVTMYFACELHNKVIKMKTIKLQINCGEKTCINEKKERCPFLLTKKFGTVWLCEIWQRYPDGEERYLDEKDGWLQRHQECIESEKRIYEPYIDCEEMYA